MRRLILILCALCLCTTISSAGIIDRLKMVIAAKNTSGETCQVYYNNDTDGPFDDADGGVGVGEDSSGDFRGYKYNPTENIEICRIDVYVRHIQGDITPAGVPWHYYLVLFETDGTDDATAWADTNTTSQSDLVDADAIETAYDGGSYGYAVFAFSTTVNLAAATDYVMTAYRDGDKDGDVDEDSTTDNTNYWWWGYDNEKGDDTFEGRGSWTWDASIPFADESGIDALDAPGVILYTMQP